MLSQSFDYKSLVALSERVMWKLDDVITDDAVLDLEKPFLPESLVRTGGLEGFTAEEKLRFNQISGHSYCHLFYVAEEYVVVDALCQATRRLATDRNGARAWTRISDDENKHQQMFQRLEQAMARQFPCRVAVFEGASMLAGEILKNSSLAVLLLSLHLEASSLVHFTEAIRDDRSLEPLFVSVLKHHWQEESQHVKVDAVTIAELAAQSTPAEIEQSLDQYFGLVGALDQMVIASQAAMDLDTLEQAIGRKLTDAQRAALLQARPLRRAFIEMGLENPLFLGRLSELGPTARERAIAYARGASPN